MPPQLATLVTILVILYFFRAERKTEIEGFSRAVWVPFFWMFLAGSRYVSQWLDYNATLGSSEAYLDGSPLDRGVFLLLIVLGVLILVRRNLNWKMLCRNNAWICVFLLFGLASTLWSDYPFVSLKRWIKALGTPIMALVILTERRPWAAVGAVLRRLSYVTLPLSVLFIKYYPHLGRAYHMGRPTFTGVAMQKNGLGQMCLIAGIYFFWDLLFSRQTGIDARKSRRFSTYVLILAMIVWLLNMGDSATSLISLVLSISIILISRMRSVATVPGRIMSLGLAVLVLVGLLEVLLGLSAQVLNIVGRDPTLTTRVPMWKGLMEMAGNRLVGVGYESFWLGRRLPVLLEAYGVRQAHNGYLETYLNLGLVGLALIVGIIISGLLRVRKQLYFDYGSAILRLTLIAAVIVYNWTEATLYGVSNMWLLLFLGIVDTSDQREVVPAAETSSPNNNQPIMPVSRT